MSEIEPLFMNVQEFCQAARIGRRTFYSLQSQGRGPLVTKIGDRNLITPADAQAWRLRMKTATLKQIVNAASAADEAARGA